MRSLQDTQGMQCFFPEASCAYLILCLSQVQMKPLNFVIQGAPCQCMAKLCHRKIFGCLAEIFPTISTHGTDLEENEEPGIFIIQ